MRKCEQEPRDVSQKLTGLLGMVGPKIEMKAEIYEAGDLDFGFRILDVGF